MLLVLHQTVETHWLPKDATIAATPVYSALMDEIIPVDPSAPLGPALFVDGGVRNKRKRKRPDTTTTTTPTVRGGGDPMVVDGDGAIGDGGVEGVPPPPRTMTTTVTPEPTVAWLQDGNVNVWNRVSCVTQMLWRELAAAASTEVAEK